MVILCIAIAFHITARHIPADRTASERHIIVLDKAVSRTAARDIFADIDTGAIDQHGIVDRIARDHRIAAHDKLGHPGIAGNRDMIVIRSTIIRSAAPDESALVIRIGAWRRGRRVITDIGIAGNRHIIAVRRIIARKTPDDILTDLAAIDRHDIAIRTAIRKRAQFDITAPDKSGNLGAGGDRHTVVSRITPIMHTAAIDITGDRHIAFDRHRIVQRTAIPDLTTVNIARRITIDHLDIAVIIRQREWHMRQRQTHQHRQQPLAPYSSRIRHCH